MIPSGLKNEIRNRFKTIRQEAHRTIFILSEPEKEDCPNCLSDHTGASINTFDSSFVSPVVIFGETISPTSFNRGKCPICSGTGYLEQESKTGIQALVRWNPTAEDSRGVLAGTEAGREGYNVVQVKADECYYTTLKNAKKAVIDGIECEVLLPPVYRTVGYVDITIVAYFVSVEVGHGVRE